MKKPQLSIRQTKCVARDKGFALVITLMLLILLSLLCVGMLSLSSISLRSSAETSGLSKARANARLAMMIAIGRLQAELGPDQRISANGSILPNATIKNPHWTGAWDSWKAGTVASGADATSEHSTIEGATNTGMNPSYQVGRQDHFRSWLVSLDPGKEKSVSAAAQESLAGSNNPDKTADAVQLVGMGSLGNGSLPEDFVSASLVAVNSPTGTTTGRYGWWVGDESQKARIMDDSYNTRPAGNIAEKIARAQAPGSTGTTTIKGLEKMTDDTQLAALPSFASLDLVKVSPPRAANADKPAQMNFHHATPFSYGVLSDVREGGLKRDLSTLLERKIDISEYDNKFMLYKFNTMDNSLSSYSLTRPQEYVPIQDLAAYYQLYDAVSPGAAAKDPFRTSSSRGVQYSSPYLSDGMQLLSVDYGTTSFSPIYPREYTALYRQPKIIKVQFLLSLFSQKISPPIPADRTNPSPNTHELLMGVTPSITLWNPTNLPLMMQMRNNPALVTQMMRFNDIPLQIRINKNNGQFVSNFAATSGLATSGGFGSGGTLFNLYWSGIHPIRLEPGEVKTLSLPYSGDLSTLKAQLGYNGHWNQGGNMSNFFFKTDTYFVGHEVKVGWEPESFILMGSSASPNDPGPAPAPTATDKRNVVNGFLRFKSSDNLSIELGSGGSANLIDYMNNQSCYQDYNAATSNWDRYNCLMNSRNNAGVAFNQSLFAKGMTGGQTNLLSPSRSGASIIARSATSAGWPFMQYSFEAGVETSDSSNSSMSAGRKFASRPFLHSSPLHSSPCLDNNTGNALYNFGWNWSADLINDVYEAPIQVTPSGQGYYGGGYTPESGSTHVIQQEIPVIPPMSIAALSHARLGGWSLNDEPEMAYGSNPGQMSGPGSSTRHQLMRAVGFGGLFPHTLQAIGNSYAHPQIPADKAYTTMSRTFSVADGAVNVTFADHSYLANKALWDEFFFSSLTPQPSEVKVFESSNRTVEQVAEDFFFKDQPLPNRRMTPYNDNMDDSVLADLMAKKDDFENGLADQIGAHLMVEGPFNVNSTSVEAWKIFFSSLKGKPVAYLDGNAAMNGNNPSVSTGNTGAPVGQTGLGGGTPFSGSPNSPRTANQWTSWRALTDTEIDELAVAMVKQVKLRGPFLSLSEFVNRRLQSGNPELAVKGALQAALDDPAVSINAAFRTNERKFSNAEVSSMSPAFKEAAEGPVAYGSSAYIDQADVLRGFAGQLTPRGDTFVIRTYGDSLDGQGNVEARVWCEAVVQRYPEYIDQSVDETSAKQKDLTSDANKTFGRRFKLVSFRWLNASEV